MNKDFREMEQVDLRLQLLSGDSLKVDNIELFPYKIKEIKDYGYSKYMMNLQWLSITVDDFIKSVLDIEKRMILEVEKSKLKTFDFYTKLGGQEMLYGMIEALKMIFKTDDVSVIDDGVIAIDFVKKGILAQDEDGQYAINQEVLDKTNENEMLLIHRDNFDDIVEAIKLMNYLRKPVGKSREENPADEATRQLLEEMKKNEERVKKAKQREREDGGDDDEIDISDIISAVTVKSNSTNKLNVWEFTLFQLYDEYARLELIDNYDFSIKAMMAGAEKIDLKHWSSRL